MLLDEIFKVALQAIRANKLRSLLTALGIIIGVGAVITMLALGSGAQKAVQDRIAAMGPDLLSIYPGQNFRGGIAIMGNINLTMADDTALANSARYLKAVIPELTRNLQVKRLNQNINVNVVGTIPEYVPVKNYTFTAGRMFTNGENESRQRYAVLGSSIPDMFAANPAGLVGTTIQIRGIEFQVIGVLSSKGSGGGFGNPDEQILVPLQTARYRVIGTDRLRTITAQIQNMQSMNLALIEIERVLRRQHHIRPGNDNDFQIRNPTDILATFEQTTQTFKLLLAGIAAVSLVVGGIGIMNIMLVSVTERTREIGLRQAVGARARDVLRQFLVEAATLTTVGAVVGLVVGGGLTMLIRSATPIEASTPPIAIVAALACSSLAGIVFGMLPAFRASRLDPVEALRYE